MPCIGQATDHNIESVVVGLGDMGEEKGGIGEVSEVDDFGEKEIRFVYGVDEHLGVYLLQLFGGCTFFQEGQERLTERLLFSFFSLWVVNVLVGA